MRDQLGLFPNEQIRKDSYEGREADRRALIAALVEAGEWPPPAKRVPGYSAALAEAVERFAARSRSGLLAVQFEDWLGMEDPVNVPGTSTEHANWQRKLTLPFVDIVSDPRIWVHATKLNARRDNQAEE